MSEKARSALIISFVDGGSLVCFFSLQERLNIMLIKNKPATPSDFFLSIHFYFKKKAKAFFNTLAHAQEISPAFE
jgi:hypothetical protein